jgi:predicted DNA-binding ribbon-helix-helix protein
MTIGYLISLLGDKKGKGKKFSSNIRPFTMAWYKQRGFYLTWDKRYNFIEKGF